MQETGDSTTAVMSQKALSEVVQPVYDAEKIDLSQYEKKTGTFDQYTYKPTQGQHYEIPVSAGDAVWVTSSVANQKYFWCDALPTGTSNVSVSSISSDGANAKQSGQYYIAYAVMPSGASYVMLDLNNNPTWNIWVKRSTTAASTSAKFTDGVGLVDDDSADSDFAISDGKGNRILEITDGVIKTQKFDSSKVEQRSGNTYSSFYYGEKISLEKHGYSIKKIMRMNSSVNSTFQASCVYDKYIFLFQKNGTINIYDFSKDYYCAAGSNTTEGWQMYNLPLQSLTISYDHPGQACFGKEFHTAGDMFPLLYVSHGNTTDGVVSVYRISGAEGSWTIELVQTITLPTDESTFMTNLYAMVDIDRSLLVVLGLTAAYATGLTNTYKVTTFPLPLLSAGNVTYTASQSSGVKTVASNMPVPQCGFALGDKLYIAEGGNNQARIDVIDYIQGTITSTIKLTEAGITTEPEAVVEYNGKLYFTLANGSTFEIITD